MINWTAPPISQVVATVAATAIAAAFQLLLLGMVTSLFALAVGVEASRAFGRTRR
jgi:hypothetical protein